MRKKNREEDFDFGQEILQDVYQPVWSKPTSKPKSKIKPLEDFIGLDDEDLSPPKPKQQPKQSIFPTINNRSPQSYVSHSSGKKAGDNSKLQSLSKREHTNYDYDFMDEDIEGELPAVKPAPKPVVKLDNKSMVKSQVKPKNMQDSNIQVEPFKAPAPVKKEPESKPASQEVEESYKQDFEDDYIEDFDQFHEQQVKVPPLKSIQQKEVQNSPQRISNTVRTIQKKSILNSISRRSLQGSRQNKRSITQMSKSNISHPDIQPKFSQQVQSSLPSQPPSSIPDLRKANDKIRNMIRKYNEQLNDILSKNALAIRRKEQGGNKHRSLDEHIEILAKEKENNGKLMEAMRVDITRMRFREGEVKEEDYEFEIIQQIERTKLMMKEVEKDIAQLQYLVQHEGNRLSNYSPVRESEVMRSLKGELIHLKMEEQRQTGHLQKLETKIVETDGNITEADKTLRKLMKQAEEKGIDLDPHSEIKKRYADLKLRVEAEKKALMALEALQKVKQSRINQQIILLKRQVGHTQLQIKNVQDDLEHGIIQSKELIQKTKHTGSKSLPKQVLEGLDIIESALVMPSRYYGKYTQRNSAKSTDRSRLFSRHSAKKEKSTKAVSKERVEIINQSKLSKSRVETKERDNNNRSEPKPPKMLFHKQDKNQEKQEFPKTEERIWTDEKIQSTKNIIPVAPPLQVQPSIAEVPKTQETTKPQFMLKKKGLNQTPDTNLPNSTAQNTPTQISKQASNFKSQNTPFEKQKPNPIQFKIQDTSNFKSQSNPNTDRPFAIGRMRALRKNENSQNQDEKQQIKPPEADFMSTNVSGPSIPANQVNVRQVQSVVTQEPVAIAPKRIIMRKRGQNKQSENTYNPGFGIVDSKPQNPPIVEKVLDPTPFKVSDTPKNANTDTPINTNPTNPYAPRQDSGQGYRPQREGRLKKANKIQIPTEKFNLNDVAQEQVNEFIAPNADKKNDAYPPMGASKNQDQELDMNELLGIKPKKNTDDEDGLMFRKKPQNTKKSQPPSDFFNF